MVFARSTFLFLIFTIADRSVLMKEEKKFVEITEEVFERELKAQI